MKCSLDIKMSNPANLSFSLNKTIGPNHPTFIIAEIGQNHQGNFDTAKLLIKLAKDSGADCVKFQKTCLTEKYNKGALNRSYTSHNSWGNTYGEHKAFLEFSDEQFLKLQQYAKDINILFTASAMDSISLKFLAGINVPFIKIGSGDSNNFLLLEEAASTSIPLVISTGMQNQDTVNKIYQCISKFHKKFCLLHCVSSYPTPVKDINLQVINMYQQCFPDINIGYSGHEIGIDITVAAVAMGAKVIERHLTLDKNQKGSDHNCSLEPEEFKLLVNKIRILEEALGTREKKILTSEIPCYEKLGKTLVFSKSFQKNHKLSISDMKVKVAEPKGIDAAKIYDVIGLHINSDVEDDDSITPNILQNYIEQ